MKHFQKVSPQVNLCSPCRLSSVETFCLKSVSFISKDHVTSLFIWYLKLKVNWVERYHSAYQVSSHVSLRMDSERICSTNPFKPFPNKPWFLRVCRTSLLKTLWEIEILLIRRNFSFSHSVCYPFWELSAIFVKFEIVVCKLFQVSKSLKFVDWERVKRSDVCHLKTKIAFL